MLRKFKREQAMIKLSRCEIVLKMNEICIIPWIARMMHPFRLRMLCTMTTVETRVSVSNGPFSLARI